ncbi:MAG: twin-arginine translocase subunit TatC [Anaerolineales bacterium]|nr:MAG: twin-arginine translocase subunit TatC [Anaerolineales bacterium]
MSENRPMTVLGHLVELRGRLIKAILALIITTLVSLLFTPRFLKLLTAPMGDNLPQAIGPTETIVIYFKVALIGGLVLAMPVIVYQLISFLVPGLYPQERRYLYVIVPAASFLFALGVAFAHYVMLPAAIPFLLGFMGDIIRQQWTIEKYMSLVTGLLFWVGVIFETPLVIAFLAYLGVVSPGMLWKNFRYAIVGIAVIAAVATPTPDPINMALLMLPLVLLYLLSILLALFVYRRRETVTGTASDE